MTVFHYRQNYLQQNAVVLWSPYNYPLVGTDYRNIWILPPDKFDDLKETDQSLITMIRKDGAESLITPEGTIYRSQKHSLETYHHITTFECGGCRLFYPEVVRELVKSGIYCPNMPKYLSTGDLVDEPAVKEFLAELKQRKAQEEEKIRKRAERYEQFSLACLNLQHPTPERFALIRRAFDFDVFYDFSDSATVSANGEKMRKQIEDQFESLGMNVAPFKERFTTRYDRKGE